MIVSEIEVIGALALSTACYSYRRALSGWKNAAFYAKGGDEKYNRLEKYIKNLHFLETPAWYAQAGQSFPLLYLVARATGLEVQISLLFALVLTYCSSAIAGPFYQCPINISAGKECIDKSENPKSEFAWGLISFWWPRPWRGWYRVIGAIIGLLGAIGSLIFLLNN